MQPKQTNNQTNRQTDKLNLYIDNEILQFNVCISGNLENIFESFEDVLSYTIGNKNQFSNRL